MRETGAAAGTGLLLVLCWHLPAAMGCFRAADTPGITEGPTGVLWGCAGARSCFSRNQHLHKSPAPALPWLAAGLGWDTLAPWWDTQG